MEELKKEFQKFTLRELKDDQPLLKTSIVYHLDTLKHKSDQQHVENPDRVSSILKTYNESNLSPELYEEITDCNEVSLDLIELTHGKSYVEYFNKTLQDCKGVQYESLDTYYNKETRRAALLSAECTKIAAERVWLKQCLNSFAIVRPPGHHAGAEGHFKGFCFINNVVLAAKNLIKNHGAKRIAILDWDVHHGDSTQNLTYDDPQILYMSIHKYMNGTFYPGPSGNLQNLGKGQGEGFNLNFPLNPLKDQVVSDQDYIYIFEAAIKPVLQAYNPEIILISCGLDCLLHDPLGGLHLTQDSLCYILFYLKNIFNDKICVALEGGYNTTQISKVAYNLIKILGGYFFPNGSNIVRIKGECYPNEARPLPNLLDNFDQNIEAWSKYWPCLKEQKNIEYRQQIRQQVETELNWTNHLLQNYKKFGTRIIKQAKPKEVKFFQQAYPFWDELQDLIPRFYGIIKTDKGEFVKLENFVPDVKDCGVLMLKINGQKVKETVSQLWIDEKYDVIGYWVKKKGQLVERMFGDYLKISPEALNDLLARFFQSQNKKIKKKIIKSCSEQLQKLIDLLNEEKCRLQKCNLFVIYDRTNDEVKVRVINFSNFGFTNDQNSIFALENFQHRVEKLVYQFDQLYSLNLKENNSSLSYSSIDKKFANKFQYYINILSFSQYLRKLKRIYFI